MKLAALNLRSMISETRENLDESADLMTERRKNAYTLRKKIDSTRNALMHLMDPKDTLGMNLSLRTVDAPDRAGFPHKNWERANFGEGIPMGCSHDSTDQNTIGY